MLGWEARGPQFDSQERTIFFQINSILRGNEPNGEQQQVQGQLKQFLALWPMAADKNIKNS